MSDEEESPTYDADSPPMSPTGPVSSPVQGSDGSATDEETSNSSASCSATSPPSSPVRGGHKRPAYMSHYRDDHAEMIPRQTLASRAKKRREDEHPENFVEHRDENGSQPPNVAPFDEHHEVVPDQDEENNDAISELPHDEDRDSGKEVVAVRDEGNTDRGEPDEDQASSTLSESDDSDEGGIDTNIDVNLSDGELSIGSSSHSCERHEPELSESDDGDYEDPFGDVNLYPGSEKTTDEAIYELIRIYLSNNLSQTALKDILRFYSSSLPSFHNMPSSHHLLLNRVKEFSVPLFQKEHYYCRPALHTVISKLGPCGCGSTDIGVFYELPLEKRIQHLFEHRGLADVIDSYAAVRNQRDGNIRDVLDGSEYVRVWEGRFGKYKITLILNTDGVSPHKSSKAKFWPLLFTLMEISPELRSTFTILWGLWFDKSLKPDMNLFLKPFVDSLVKIAQEGGVKWQHPRTGKIHVSPVCCPLCIADAPARANCLNMQEHQAKYACSACEQKTNKLPVPPAVVGQKRPRRKRRFLFQENPSQFRTHEKMVKLGQYAENRNLPKRGVKGKTVLEDVPHLDLSTCVLAEYMHCILSGVVKQICSLWFFKAGDWFIGKDIPAMDEFLQNEVHPPDYVSRLPRSFEYFAYFKANEFRSFLLYFSIILVFPYLKEKYFQHWMLLVQSVFILLSSDISEVDLLSANVMIRLFLRDLGSLYGDEEYVYNVHQLVHVVMYVRRWGPLWATSAFAFKNFNGILSKMLHGSKNEGQELLNQLSLAQAAQILKNKVVTDARNVSRIVPLGKPLQYVLSDAESIPLHNLLNDDMESLQFYGRLLRGREVLSSQYYDGQFKRHNSYVQLSVEGKMKYGRIIVFCKSKQCIMCLVKVLRVDQSKFFYHNTSRTRIKHVVPVEDSGEVLACEVKCIGQKLIQAGNFLCFPPNSVESNL